MDKIIFNHSNASVIADQLCDGSELVLKTAVGELKLIDNFLTADLNEWVFIFEHDGEYYCCIQEGHLTGGYGGWNDDGWSFGGLNNGGFELIKCEYKTKKITQTQKILKINNNIIKNIYE